MMKLVLLPWALLLISLQATAIELPPEGTMIQVPGTTHPDEVMPAPFAAHACEELLSGKAWQSVVEDLDLRPGDERFAMFRRHYATAKAWSLLNMIPRSFKNYGWRMEFSHRNGQVFFQVIRAGGTIAYEKLIPKKYYVASPRDPNSASWIGRSPYVILEELESARIVLIPGSGLYELAIDAPCEKLDEFLKLDGQEIEAFPVIHAMDKQWCRFNLFEVHRETRRRGGGLRRPVVY